MVIGNGKTRGLSSLHTCSESSSKLHVNTDFDPHIDINTFLILLLRHIGIIIDIGIDTFRS